MEDSNIVDLYWARSEHAITETASKYGKYCYAIANNILHNVEDADESVSDTYLGAWNSMPSNRPSVLRTYLGKIIRRTSLKKWRDKNRDKRGGGEVALVLDELEECVPSNTIVEEVIAAELSEMLNRFVAKLPETERRVFLSRYWYLDSIEQISLDFNFSNSKVKSMLHRTRQKLLSHLRQEGVQ
jgi:RNA polymerase sigma-70 factor (ECF subfamily)